MGGPNVRPDHRGLYGGLDGRWRGCVVEASAPATVCLPSARGVQNLRVDAASIAQNWRKNSGEPARVWRPCKGVAAMVAFDRVAASPPPLGAWRTLPGLSSGAHRLARLDRVGRMCRAGSRKARLRPRRRERSPALVRLAPGVAVLHGGGEHAGRVPRSRSVVRRPGARLSGAPVFRERRARALRPSACGGRSAGSGATSREKTQ
jgi:hypothetical protein